ncbi:hypothetical protein ACJ73_07063 [Blastomyces percursus]|uniref:Uncharacterized protein n=1 Tax=Blastomyces percursus TaxID=1658174 RepID=A0A1J9QN13_9EURO|nr:hypothetical protein ACJ73_07063 [Blastomyces percursus]
MPRNIRHRALETHNDEMEGMDEDIETESEDPQYPRIHIPEQIPTSEPDISYRLYEQVVINDKECFKDQVLNYFRK